MRIEHTKNGVALDCQSQDGIQMLAGEIGGVYGLGIGDGEDGHGLFIDREQAAELLESLLEFIEGGE